MLNTFTGKEDCVTYKTENGHTTIWYDFYENDSILLKLVKAERGEINYREKINLSEKSNLCINVAGYCGTLSKVLLDGKDVGNVVFAPYDKHLDNVPAGEHTIEFVLYGNSHNTFGGLHNCGISIYYGQGYWYSTENSWSYEYNLRKTGILKSPVIKIY